LLRLLCLSIVLAVAVKVLACNGDRLLWLYLLLLLLSLLGRKRGSGSATNPSTNARLKHHRVAQLFNRTESFDNVNVEYNQDTSCSMLAHTCFARQSYQTQRASPLSALERIRLVRAHPHDRVALKLAFVDKVVELRSQHAVGKVNAIANDQSEAFWLIGTRLQNFDLHALQHWDGKGDKGMLWRFEDCPSGAQSECNHVNRMAQDSILESEACEQGGGHDDNRMRLLTAANVSIRFGVALRGLLG